MVEPIGRRLIVEFAGWLDAGKVDVAPFVQSGLVVLDANVLLSLYRIAPEPRSEVLAALRAVGDRLWVPHQSALEFSRNRRGVVEDRVRSFSTVERALSEAPAAAVDAIEAALDQFRHLRQRSATTRRWGPAEDPFNAADLLAQLGQVMDPVLTELATMRDEHDLHPADVSSVDPVLRQIDLLLHGRIGHGYPSSRLRQLVDEAISFRYPNEIPPGFRDNGKDTPIRRAGDVLLWHQVLDRAADLSGDDRRVLLVTNDLKDDWWQVDQAKARQGPRAELVQELRDRTGADLLLRTLDEFVADARTHLPVHVSEQTVDAVRDALDELEWPLPSTRQDSSAPFAIMELSPLRFQSLVYHLLVAMGFSVRRPDRSDADLGFDFLLTSPPSATGPRPTTVVEVQKLRSPVGTSVILEVLGAMRANGADAGLVITTATFTTAAENLARAEDVRLIDGPELVTLLAEHLDVHGQI